MAISVHDAHCCKKHGCKYGDDDCPVVLGTEPGVRECEYCRMDAEDRSRAPSGLQARLEKARATLRLMSVDGWKTAEYAQAIEDALACIREQQAALHGVLESRDKEAAAEMSKTNAYENLTESESFVRAWEKAMIASSIAEQTARATLARWRIEP